MAFLSRQAVVPVAALSHLPLEDSFRWRRMGGKDFVYFSGMKPNSRKPELSQAEPLDSATKQQAATAYHEAGHAVMALMLGRTIQKVTVSHQPPANRWHAAWFLQATKRAIQRFQ